MRRSTFIPGLGYNEHTHSLIMLRRKPSPSWVLLCLSLQLFWLLLQGNSLRRRPLRVVNLLSTGQVPYGSAWEWQHRLMDHHIMLQEGPEQGQGASSGFGFGSGSGSGSTPASSVCGTVLVLEHKSVYTLGTATQEGSGPFSQKMPDGSALPYELFHVERAGEATYHGPGQLVIYPILDLSYFEKDINKYLRGLEQVVMDSLAEVGIPSAGRIKGLTGVWVGDDKFAAIGIKLRRWVTMHGVAVNVCPDMRYFGNIVPCGIKDKGVGSIATYPRCAQVSVPHFATVFLANFCREFEAYFPDQEVLEGDRGRAFVESL